MNKATKWINLALIGSSVILTGCSRIPEETMTGRSSGTSGTASRSRAHVYPGWWWWYVHRPYFASPRYGTGAAHHYGSGGSFVRRVGGGYVAGRSALGRSMISKTFSPARSTVSGSRSSGSASSGISGRGGFGGGSSVS